MQILDKGNQVPALRDTEGVWQLMAERRWLLHGSADDVAQARLRLGTMATPITKTVLELDFGNAVGSYPLGNGFALEVSSRKCSTAEFDGMLRNLSEAAATLPFASGGGGQIGYERALVDADHVVYHAFAYLRSLLGAPRSPGDQLAGAIASIVTRPHTRSVRRGRVVPTALARRVDPAVLTQIASGRFPMQRSVSVAAAARMGGLVPAEVEESIMAHDLDTAENRFVKAVLDLCLGIVHRVAKAAEKKKSAARLRGECIAMEAELGRLRRHRMWSEVGPMLHFPTSSTTLQRRQDYAAIFVFYNRLRLGSRLPLTTKGLWGLLEVKDIALLYELWTFFALVRAVAEVLGEPECAKVVETSVLAADVRRGMTVRWPGGASVSYNPSFSRTARGGRRSYSVPLRPDVVLTVPDGPGKGRHVFDAKFKFDHAAAETGDDGEGEEVRRATRGDLYKMHTYRDALQDVRSAWVVYPGTEVRWFPVRVGEEFDGVGAMPLAIDGSDAGAVEIVRRMTCHHGA